MAVAIISGGLGDIGRAIARELSKNAKVAIGDVRDACDLPYRYDRVDVSDAAAVDRWVGAVETSLGTPAWIIANAAIVTRKTAITVTSEEWERELRVNLSGAFHLAQAGAKRLIELKLPGRIVFIGSWAAEVAHPQIAAYSVAKAGLRMLAKCMALELAPHNILVNEVAAGYVDAGLSRQLFEQDPALRDRCVKQVPIQRLAQPEDVAREVAHVCQTNHMTGSVVLVDGGLSLRSTR
jgi:NAD(P)-dependent dehydrogenase (short-subunit alcohol dehydrogenase family)